MMQKQIILTSENKEHIFENKIKSLGVQGYPNDQFKINNNSIITIDKFGLYEVELNKPIIYQIELIKSFGSLIVDYE